MVGQTDSQVGSQVHASRIYSLLAINLCRLALGGQTVKHLRRLGYEFELGQCQRKSKQVNASGWPNETEVERKSKTCVDLRRLVSPFGKGFTRFICSYQITTFVRFTYFDESSHVKYLCGKVYIGKHFSFVDNGF